jgi:tetratricopeptide (TPR) repeat protein
VRAKKRYAEEPAPATAGRKRGGFLPFVLGGILAAVLVGGGAAGAWYFDALPKSPNAQAAKGGVGTGTGSGGGQQQGPVATDAQKARALIDEGKYAEALDLVKDADKGPELAMKGLASFKKHEADKKTVKADDPKVQESLKQIKDGGAEAVAKEISDRLEKEDRLANADVQLTQAREETKQAQSDKNAAVKQLDKYKQLEKTLVDAKIPVDPTDLKTFVAGLGKGKEGYEKEIKTLTAAKMAVESQLNDVNAALAKAGVKDAKEVAGLVTMRDSLMKERDTLNAMLTKERDAHTKALTTVAKERDAATKERDTLKADRDVVAKERDALAKDSKDFGDLIENALVALGLDKKTDKRQLVTSIKDAVSKTDKELRADLAKTRDQLTDAKKQMTEQQAEAKKQLANALAKVEPAEQRLDVILAALRDRGFKDAGELDRFAKFADAVRKDAKASPEARARAAFAEALILRNQEKFAEARNSLEQAIKEAAALKDGKALQAAAEQTHKELTDPAAYYLSGVDRRMAAGQHEGAVADLNTALKALPNNPNLLLARGWVTFEAARRKGKIDDATAKQIRDDADLVRKDPKLAAEAFYLVGQLDENNGAIDQAKENYKQAIKLAGDSPRAEVFLVALGRLLLRAGPAATEEAPEEEEEVKDELAFTAVAFVDERDEAVPQDEDPLAIAERLIQSKDEKIQGEGYMMKGIALAKRDKAAEGLTYFVKGFKMVHRDWTAEQLEIIISKHPGLKQRDVVSQPMPLQGETHFNKGLAAFWAKKYADAEAQFEQAVQYYDQDARYWYFLGMSRYLQGTKEKQMAAEFAFGEGAFLEKQRKPGTRDINISLERVQGEMRTVLNNYREKLLTPK